MASISAKLSNLLSGDIASTPAAGKVELPFSVDEPLVNHPSGNVDKCELRIEGMTCGACVEVSALCLRARALRVNVVVQSIEGMLRGRPGIHSIKVALLAERGVVEYDLDAWNPSKLIEVRSIVSSSLACSDILPCTFRKYLTLASMQPSSLQHVPTKSPSRYTA